MTRYAAGTEVPVERSRVEIERTLARYGAATFVYGTTVDKAMVQFELHRRRVRFILPLPNRTERRFTHRRVNQYDYAGSRRTAADAERAWEQACRQSWRALLLAIKAKLETVEAGIETFEEAFLAQIVLPDDTTVGQWVTLPALEASKP